MLEFCAVSTEDIHPIIQMVIKQLQICAPTKLLETSDSTELNHINVSLEVVVKASPELKAISLFSTAQRNAPPVHRLW